MFFWIFAFSDQDVRQGKIMTRNAFLSEENEYGS